MSNDVMVNEFDTSVVEFAYFADPLRRSSSRFYVVRSREFKRLRNQFLGKPLLLGDGFMEWDVDEKKLSRIEEELKKIAVSKYTITQLIGHEEKILVAHGYISVVVIEKTSSDTFAVREHYSLLGLHDEVLNALKWYRYAINRSVGISIRGNSEVRIIGFDIKLMKKLLKIRSARLVEETIRRLWEVGGSTYCYQEHDDILPYTYISCEVPTGYVPVVRSIFDDAIICEEDGDCYRGTSVMYHIPDPYPYRG